MTESKAWRHALTILAGTTLLRLVIGAIVPLFPDETYYWDWSRTLMPGYFDHPPMIAVLIRAGTAVFGYHAIGVRFFSILAGSGAIYAVALTSRELAGDGAAKLAVLLLCCMPLAAVGLILATPDAPMLCAASWALYAVMRTLNVSAERDRHPLARWWLVAGLAIEQVRRARAVPRGGHRVARARAGSLLELEARLGVVQVPARARAG